MAAPRPRLNLPFQLVKVVSNSGAEDEVGGVEIDLYEKHSTSASASAPAQSSSSFTYTARPVSPMAILAVHEILMG
jgi:hypothetical protein